VMREILDEPTVEVGESEERLHLLSIHRGRPLGHSGNLDGDKYYFEMIWFTTKV
jgi:hypothetical protein